MSDTRLGSAFLLALTSTLFAGPADAASVADLAWMSGSWVGPMGEQRLEENWTHPADGSIASLVRISSGGETDLIELILIEEEEGSLVFRVRQWSRGFNPRGPEPQMMVLTELGDRRVRFEAPEPWALRSLTYSRPTDESFNIDVETGEGAKFQINLRAQ